MDDAHRLCACFFVSQNDGGYNWEVCACSSVTSGSTSRRMYCARLQNVNMSSPFVRRAIIVALGASRAQTGRRRGARASLVACERGCPLPLWGGGGGGDGRRDATADGLQGHVAAGLPVCVGGEALI